MKKMIFALAVVVSSFVVTFASFANSAKESKNSEFGHQETTVECTGKGACRHALCSCKWYVSAGTGGRCVCGHWDYVHN